MASPAAPMPPLPVRRTAPGEPQVWLTTLGLSLAMVLVVYLLSVVFMHGAGVFWPRRVHLVEVAGPAGTDLKQRAGTIVDTRPKATGKGEEVLLYIGAKERFGQSYIYVDAGAFDTETYPPEAMVIEREVRSGSSASGGVVGAPASLRRGDGSTIAGDDPGFADALAAAHAAQAPLRAQVHTLEDEKIERNRRSEELSLRRKRIDGLPATAPERAQLPGLDEEIARLSAEVQERNDRQHDLVEEQDRSVLTVRLYGSDEVTIPFSELADWYFPNRMGVFAKVGRFFYHGWKFVSSEPRESNTAGGIFPAIFGTFVMTLLMSMAVVPFGVLAAIYLREYAKQGPLVRVVRIAINNLAGVPSIVFGIFGLAFFIYFVGGLVDDQFFPGRDPVFRQGGVLWAALTLALLTLPVVIVATEEAIAAVPRGMREGSLALGASKWQTIQRIVLPASVPGILTGLILAMARGAGEVAPLMLVGAVKEAKSLAVDGTWLPTDVVPYLHLDQKFMHLGFHIYDVGFQSPDSDAARPIVFATTMILILVVVMLNLSAILIRERLRRRYATGAF